MALDTPKSVSVTEDGEPDGWTPEPGFLREMDPMGQTRLIVALPVDRLAPVHRALAAALSPPLSFLYRQVVDRRDPKPQGSPPRDFVALDLSPQQVDHALTRFTDLLHHDARCEVWVRGAMGEQIVLDADGLIYLYPDDPSFQDVLEAQGLEEGVETTIVDRDYARHLFHAGNDALEDGLIATLDLTEMRPQG